MTDEKRPIGSHAGVGISRRTLVTAGGVLAASLSNGCSKRAVDAPSPGSPEADANVIRVASVPTAVEGNLLPTLIAEFEKQASLAVHLTSAEDLYGLARAGHVDLAISHYGHRDAEAFVTDGFGEWPRTLFSNQMALLGPPSDPAKVRDLQDVGEAFRRIAASKSPFVVNHIDGVRYLTEVLWNVAGRPDRSGWLIDEGHRKDEAIRFAAERGAYSFWGLTPFLRLQREAHLNLAPLVLGDPLLQRMLVSILVKPSKVSGINAAGATAFQSFLLSAPTQARIRDVSYPGADGVQWVPGARHNRTAMLPLT